MPNVALENQYGSTQLAQEILLAGAVPYEPKQAGLLVVVNKHRFMRKAREISVYDPGDLTVSYRPSRVLLDWTALSVYIESFRTWSGTAEDAVAIIASALKLVLGPEYLRVDLVVTGTAGYRYSVSTVHGGAI